MPFLVVTAEVLDPALKSPCTGSSGSLQSSVSESAAVPDGSGCFSVFFGGREELLARRLCRCFLAFFFLAFFFFLLMRRVVVPFGLCSSEGQLGESKAECHELVSSEKKRSSRALWCSMLKEKAADAQAQFKETCRHDGNFSKGSFLIAHYCTGLRMSSSCISGIRSA